jgi:hypothetical protein
LEVEFGTVYCFSNGDISVSKRHFKSWRDQKKKVRQEGFLGRQKVRDVGAGHRAYCSCTIDSYPRSGNSRTMSQDIQYACPPGKPEDSSMLVGDNIFNVLQSKYPSTWVLEASEMEDCKTLPDFVDLEITEEIVKQVAQELSVSADLGGLDVQAIQQ